MRESQREIEAYTPLPHHAGYRQRRVGRIARPSATLGEQIRRLPSLRRHLSEMMDRIK